MKCFTIGRFVIGLWILSSCVNAQTKADNARFKELIADSNAVILDVRTPEEFSEGYIEGKAPTKNVNYFSNEFLTDVEKVAKKNQLVLVYCAAGGRSASACKDLIKAGYKKVYDLEGGYNSWE
ncbi:MAG: rhodanese-like domain-containing protein [Bacteroidota bacterium]